MRVLGMTTVSPVARPVRLMAIDNHAATLAGIEHAVGRREDIVLVGAFESVPELRRLPTPPADVVALDLYLGRDDVSSISAISDLVEWGAAVVVHTSSEVPVPLRRAVAEGAAGLALKNDGLEALFETVLAVARGQFVCSSALAQALLDDPGLVAALTSREVDVLNGLEQGLTNRQVASRLGITFETVRSHINAVGRKYVALGRDVTNAHSYVREARSEGWIGRPT